MCVTGLQENEQRSLETEEPRKAEEKLSSVSIATSHEPERPGTDQQQPDSFEDGKLFSSGFGETSFSAAEAVSISGHISYSGPVVVSGRLSVRSDASTTSGRSFAFPMYFAFFSSHHIYHFVRLEKSNLSDDFVLQIAVRMEQ